MADYTNMLAIFAELKACIERLEKEIALQQSEGSLTSAAKDSQDQPQDPIDPAFIPPLVNDDEPEKIYGGSLTDGYPDCCAVGSEFMGYFCTGTLIAPSVVLTARHCAEDYNVTRVFLKGNDVTKPKKGETINVKETRAHPDPKVDLMLLLLEKPSKEVTPRPIFRNGEIKPETALVVGFGMINPSGTKGYGDKRKAKVPVMTLDCREMEDQARYGCWAEVEMVAGHRGLKRDSCKGDSGGPLYIEDEEGKLFLLGVTSRGVRSSGKPCGNGGIYVRADRFRDWIREETGAKV